MKFTTRELVLLAVFGALWGGVEISLGSLLHALHIPMLSTILAALGIAVALIGRPYVPKRGSTLFIGIIAMLLKLFSLGGVVLGPMIGILVEALCAEIVLDLFKKPGKAAFLLAGAAAVLWTLVHPFFTGLVFFGRGLLEVWQGTIDEGSRLLGLDAHTAAIWIASMMIALRVSIGAAAGWLAWQSASLLKRREQSIEEVSEYQNEPNLSKGA